MRNNFYALSNGTKKGTHAGSRGGGSHAREIGQRTEEKQIGRGGQGFNQSRLSQTPPGKEEKESTQGVGGCQPSGRAGTITATTVGEVITLPPYFSHQEFLAILKKTP